MSPMRSGKKNIIFEYFTSLLLLAWSISCLIFYCITGQSVPFIVTLSVNVVFATFPVIKMIISGRKTNNDSKIGKKYNFAFATDKISFLTTVIIVTCGVVSCIDLMIGLISSFVFFVLVLVIIGLEKPNDNKIRTLYLIQIYFFAVLIAAIIEIISYYQYIKIVFGNNQNGGLIILAILILKLLSIFCFAFMTSKNIYYMICLFAWYISNLVFDFSFLYLEGMNISLFMNSTFSMPSLIALCVALLISIVSLVFLLNIIHLLKKKNDQYIIAD